MWRKITGFGEDRVIGMGMADNFWSMGETGPCGPCSELHYFHGDGRVDPGTFGDEPTPDGLGWMEIWNLVFMQFEKLAGGGMQPLPKPSIDTGMGLERITSVVNGVTSNYETDLLASLVDLAAEIAQKKYTGSMKDDDVSMRVIADHARASAFMIAEGIFPDRSARPYVLRRVMRRAIRHGHRLGIREPFLHKVADRVVSMMGDVYPELTMRRETIASVVEQEEVRFRATIERGLKLLEEDLSLPTVQATKVLPGGSAFKLYDTYGFPLDLTEVICQEHGMSVDAGGFESALEEARTLSQGSKLHGDEAIAHVYHHLNAKIENATAFVGYEQLQASSTVVALLANGAIVDVLHAGEQGEVVSALTPFYAESGGQMGDAGVITSSRAKFVVTDTHKPLDKIWVHQGTLESGTLRVGDAIELAVDATKRAATRRNHSATHLLHHALRTVLGEHVQQKGSLVSADRLRFDYSHGKSMSADEVRAVEQIVNEMILANVDVVTQVLPVDQARASGAMAIFGDKYGDVVRVLTMDTGAHKSVELCGGTHAKRTGDIGLFRMVSEKAIAAGVRRIEASTGLNTLADLQSIEHQLSAATRLLHCDAPSLGEHLEKLLAQQKQLSKQVADLEKKLALGGGGGTSSLDQAIERAEKVGEASVLAWVTEAREAGALRQIADSLRDKLGNGVVLVAAAVAGKTQLVVTVSKPLAATFNASNIVRAVAEVLGGSGGGRPDMAQAGCAGTDNIDAAIAKFYEVVRAMAG